MTGRQAKTEHFKGITVNRTTALAVSCGRAMEGLVIPAQYLWL